MEIRKRHRTFDTIKRKTIFKTEPTGRKTGDMENITVTYNGATASRNFETYSYTRKNAWGQIVSGIDFAEMRNNIASELEEKLNFQIRYGFLQDLAQSEIDKVCAILSANEHAEKVKNRQTEELIWLDELAAKVYHHDSGITTVEKITTGFLNMVLDLSKAPYKECKYVFSDEPASENTDISNSDDVFYLLTFEKADDWDLGHIKNQSIFVFDKFGKKKSEHRL